MRTKILGVLVCLGLAFSLQAQNDNRDYRNFPIVITLQFHCFALPFKDLKSNFSNIGIGLGTEVSLNGKQNWAQQFSAVWYHNKNLGNGLLFYSQAAWRPTVGSDVFAEVKAGAGYLYSFRPITSYKLVDGNWVSAGHQGKGMLAVPVGVSVGHNGYSSGTYFSPFVSYQFLLMSGYNKSITGGAVDAGAGWDEGAFGVRGIGC
ncbi:MAG: hypothetical protein WDN75_13910 [Bacteroidota bacterium]